MRAGASGGLPGHVPVAAAQRPRAEAVGGQNTGEESDSSLVSWSDASEAAFWEARRVPPSVAAPAHPDEPGLFDSSASSDGSASSETVPLARASTAPPMRRPCYAKRR